MIIYKFDAQYNRDLHTIVKYWRFKPVFSIRSFFKSYLNNSFSWWWFVKKSILNESDLRSSIWNKSSKEKWIEII